MKLSAFCLLFIILFATSNTIQAQSPGERAVALLKEYLSIKTANPPGDVSEAALFYERELKKSGVPVELHWTDKATGRVNVVARLKGNGSKRPLAMLNHMDTVPVNRESWTVDPYAGIEKDGYIWGRGSLDMKNFGIMQLMTMKLLAENKVELDRDVVFIAVVDEETSGALGAQWIVENVWDDIKAEYLLDEGGFGTERFFTNDDQLIFSVGVAEKKVLWLTLSVEGTPGHGSMPPPDNANFIMAQALAKIAAYETPIVISPVVAEMQRKLGNLAETAYNNALRRDTISLTVMKGYTGNPPKSNVIPDVSEAVLDCRLLPETDPDVFIADLKKVINDPRIKFSFIEKPVPAQVAPFDTELFKVMEREHANSYPGSVTLPHLIIYGTDSRFFRPLGATCYGYFPGAVSMAEYKRIHGNDERVRTESISKAASVYYNVVREFCKK